MGVVVGDINRSVKNSEIVYAKTIAGIRELFYIDDAGNEVQITSNGSVNSGGGGYNELDAVMGKSFFTTHSLKPANTYVEALHTFPTPDFTNLNSGSITITKSRLRYTLNISHANVGWDLGSLKSEVLFILGGVHVTTHRVILALGSGLPANGSGRFAYDMANINSVGFRMDKFSGIYDVGRSTSPDGFGTFVAWTGTYVTLPTALYVPPAIGDVMGMAIYLNTATNDLRVFMRKQFTNWFEIANVTSTQLSTGVRTVMIYNEAQNTGMDFTCPIGIYHS